jgi:regulator of sirC expression with transglutaminase-like and TPR domain
VAALGELAAAAAPAESRTGREAYLAALRPLRQRLLIDEVRRRQFASSDVLLRRLIEDGDGLGELYFHLGEVQRLRGAGDDLPKAVADYRRALEHPDAPPEVLRSLGLVHLRLGDRAGARDALTRYLERLPEAEDRDLIKTHISNLDRSP